MKKTATASVLEKLPGIFEDKNGLTFNEVWNGLLKDKTLKDILVLKDGKQRKGVLQGIGNRIKGEKIKGYIIQSTEDGVRWFKVDSINQLLIEELNRHIRAVESLKLPKKLQGDDQVNSKWSELMSTVVKASKLIKDLDVNINKV